MRMAELPVQMRTVPPSSQNAFAPRKSTQILSSYPKSFRRVSAQRAYLYLQRGTTALSARRRRTRAVYEAHDVHRGEAAPRGEFVDVCQSKGVEALSQPPEGPVLEVAGLLDLLWGHRCAREVLPATAAGGVKLSPPRLWRSRNASMAAAPMRRGSSHGPYFTISSVASATMAETLGKGPRRRSGSV